MLICCVFHEAWDHLLFFFFFFVVSLLGLLLVKLDLLRRHVDHFKTDKFNGCEIRHMSQTDWETASDVELKAVRNNIDRIYTLVFLAE